MFAKYKSDEVDLLEHTKELLAELGPPSEEVGVASDEVGVVIDEVGVASEGEANDEVGVASDEEDSNADMDIS